MHTVFDGETKSGYSYPMNEATELDDDYEEEAPGPSLAFPPLYVLRTVARCPKCGASMHVYALGCAAFHQAHQRHEHVCKEERQGKDHQRLADGIRGSDGQKD